MSKDKSTELTLSAHKSWWRKLNKSISVSYENSRGGGDSDSFMSCVSFNTEFDGLHIESESIISKTHITVSEEPKSWVSYDGEGKFLLPVKALTNAVEQVLSSDSQSCILEYKNNAVTVKSGDGDDILFNLDAIVNLPDMPKAPNSFSKETLIVKSDGADIFNAHKAGSLMVKPEDRDISTGQDPMSGCIIMMNKEELSFYSLFTSASSTSANIDAISIPEEFNENEELFILSNPKITSPRLSIFNNSGDKVLFGFDKKKNQVHIECDEFHISFSALNTGSYAAVNNQSGIDRLVDMATDKGIFGISVSCSKNEISSALSRFSSISTDDDRVELGVSNNSIRISSKSLTSTNSKKFSQKIMGNVQWGSGSSYSDSNWITFSVSASLLKSVLSNINSSQPFKFEVYLKPDEKVWLMFVQNGINEDNNYKKNTFTLAIGE